MNSKELQEKIRRLKEDLRDLKTVQAIGGDSWVVYRTEINYTAQPNKVNVITFVPDDAGEFVARAYWTTPDRSVPGSDFDITPDPNMQGKWYDCTYSASAVARTIMIYSTKKGKAFLTPLVTQVA